MQPLAFRGALTAALLVVALQIAPAGGARAVNRCALIGAVPPALQLPAKVPPGEPTAIERRMLAYLSTYDYRKLGWCVDKTVRDTGPYLNHSMLGTHPAVRIYYSRAMMAWLVGGKRGVPQDGAVMIKEQYGTSKPAEAYAGLSDNALRPTDWTVMIRRSSGSHDGWFWAEVYKEMFDNQTASARTAYPNAGFGLYCLRCHSSAQTASTFASLENIRGFAGTPIRYAVDESWRQPAPAPVQVGAQLERRIAVAIGMAFPPEPLDAYAGGRVPPEYVTSSQCMGCHSADGMPPFGPVMWVTPGPRATNDGTNGIDVSEYGEWRWSPMALAGRDPVFYAQVASELAYVHGLPSSHLRATLEQPIVDTCTSCHGVMGRRAYAVDHPGMPYSLSFTFETNPAHAGFEYGGLARDGISCTVCHRAAETQTPPKTNSLAHFLGSAINGSFDTAPSDRLDGPFKDDVITTHAMREALGIKPVYDPYLSSSRMCGSCHTIDLPVIDTGRLRVVRSGSNGRAPEFDSAHNVEQATYVEWLNSRYQTEYGSGSGARSCQDCHMPAGLDDPAHDLALTHLATRIALIEDTTYPRTTGAASHADLDVRLRKTGFRRHELLGLNAFLLETFKQFPDTLGVRTTDYMSQSNTSLDQAIHNVALQARTATARVHVHTHVEGRLLVADVEVRNLTGHRFPTGVAFRRAFIDFEVRDTTVPGSPPFFVSGKTDSRGRIVGADGRPLPSESFARDSRGKQQYQDHYDARNPITRPDQVQIFEELTRDAQGDFTTSFLRRDQEVKDNRILPAGWTRAGRVKMPAYFLEATYPKGRAASDAAYTDGQGHAVVRYVVQLPAGADATHLKATATLYYQSWAPYYLELRTSEAGVDSKRLRQLIDGLELRATPLDGWRLFIASDSAG